MIYHTSDPICPNLPKLQNSNMILSKPVYVGMPAKFKCPLGQSLESNHLYNKLETDCIADFNQSARFDSTFMLENCTISKQ